MISYRLVCGCIMCLIIDIHICKCVCYGLNSLCVKDMVHVHCTLYGPLPLPMDVNDKLLKQSIAKLYIACNDLRGYISIAIH